MAKDSVLTVSSLEDSETKYSQYTPILSAVKTLNHKKQLSDLRLEICCLSSGCPINDKAAAEETVTELREYIDTAALLGTPYIRVLADSRAEPSAEVDDDVVIDSLKSLVPYAEEKGVILLVETNGAYADTGDLQTF